MTPCSNSNVHSDSARAEGTDSSTFLSSKTTYSVMERNSETNRQSATVRLSCRSWIFPKGSRYFSVPPPSIGTVLFRPAVELIELDVVPHSCAKQRIESLGDEQENLTYPHSAFGFIVLP